MRHGRDDQPGGASTGTKVPGAPSFKRLAVNGVVIVAVCALVAACGSSPPRKTSSKSRSKEYFSEKKYGVSASPRVATAGKPVRKGGGRNLVGRPYKVASKWYRPRANKNYKKTGYASWYGAAFHGRLTANGEVYDMNSLTAAHPTLPLPSYVRVTNLRNKRSVIVRVNDRGPFHGRRVIDLSKRTADLLDFRKNGVAKVRVRYVGRAPLHGRDHAQLMASYRGPGQSSPGATMPGTMLASAEEPGAAPTASSYGLAGTRPPSRPYNVAPAPIAVAFDPASAYGEGAGSVMFAALGEQKTEIETPPPDTRDVTSTTGTYNPDTPPEDTASGPATPAEAPHIRRVRTVSFKAPGETKPAAPRRSTATTVTTQPVRAVPAPPTRAPAIRSTLPPGPIPAVNVGGADTPSGIGGPFVAYPTDGTSSVAAGALFYNGDNRVSTGHKVIASIAQDTVPLTALNTRIAAHQKARAQRHDVVIRLGLFRDAANAERLARKLAAIGRVDSRTLIVKGSPMTMASLTALRSGISAAAAIRAAERAGARGAFRVK